MRRPRLWLRACAVRRLRPRLPDRVLLQGTWRVPVVQCPAHGGDHGASDGSRLPTPASAEVGVGGAEAAALLSCTATTPSRARPCGCSCARWSNALLRR